MDTIICINNIAKITYISIMIYLVFIKIINYLGNDKRKLLVVIFVSILGAILNNVLISYIGKLYSILMICFVYSYVIAKITNNEYKYSIIITFISLMITYLVYIISIALAGVFTKIIDLNVQKDNPLILVIIIGIESSILYAFFKVKRFKNGIIFLQNKEKIYNIGLIDFMLIGLTMLMYALFGIESNKKFAVYMFTGIIIELICIVIWIRRKITKYYRQKMKEKTIKELEDELNKKDEEISKILEENKEIAIINHKYSSRIKALEEVSIKILSKPELLEKMKTEFGAEFGELQTQIKKLSEEYSKELKDKIKSTNELEKTGIFGIDNILEYMSNEATKNNIDFNLKINGNIKYMAENLIEESKLETLLGDHIKDAIIAINSSENEYKDILVEIGKSKDHYEVCIYDTGIEFEIDTLLKLGLEQVTTHKATGGSGIGFITTFETLKLTNASLIIEERYPINNTDYTKIIKIKFDGKCEYKICSYRAEEISSKLNDDRIIVEHLH